MDIIDEMEVIVEKLNGLQNYIDNLPTALSMVDSKMCDLRHGIEHNVMNTKGCYRLFQEFKKLTLERRKIRNDMELSRTLTTHLNKIISAGNRDFLIHELKKTNGRLNQPYRNRVYTEEQMDYFLGRCDNREVLEREHNNILDTNEPIDD